MLMSVHLLQSVLEVGRSWGWPLPLGKQSNLPPRSQRKSTFSFLQETQAPCVPSNTGWCLIPILTKCFGHEKKKKSCQYQVQTTTLPSPSPKQSLLMHFNSGPSLPLVCQPEALLGSQHSSLGLATMLPSSLFGGIGFNVNVCDLCPERRSKKSRRSFAFKGSPA